MELKLGSGSQLSDYVEPSNHPIVELKQELKTVTLMQQSSSNHPIVELKLEGRLNADRQPTIFQSSHSGIET